MAKIDRLKEEIGWLKVVFGVLVALNVSLVGWLAQNYATASLTLRLLALGAAGGLVIGIARVNHLAYLRMRELEDA